MTDTNTVLAEIERERAAQDQQWGGTEHDDSHRPELWDGLIWKFLRRAAEADRRGQWFGSPEWHAERRRRLVQVAALAVAAIESMDRQLGR